VRRNRILVVDEEDNVRFTIRDFLEVQNYEVVEADSCRSAEEAVRSAAPDAGILDYRLPDGNALDLLPRLKQIDPAMPLIILTAYGSIELAVRAIKEGADHFLTKPVELATLLVILERLLENRRNRQRQLANRPSEASAIVDPFLGTSPAIQRLAEDARKVLDVDSPVLIEGETGTGKGLLARWLHDHSPRAEEPFVAFNSAGLSREFLETELFGHEKGAFTGAIATKSGLLEVAHRGTVFFDEIGDVDPQVQPKLLTVLEEKRFRRLGDVRDRHVDIRLLAATNRDPLMLVGQGTFRRDLYFRISTIRLAIPPLRERTEDIPVLARYLLGRCAIELRRGAIELSPGAEEALRAYAWPGNIRELRNVMERAVLLTTRSALGVEDLRFDIPPELDALAGDDAMNLREVERRLIERALRAERGNVGRAARRLGIPRSSLYHKIKVYGIKLNGSKLSTV
jgi:DNA-binding NtrC family response regulator